jgi:hypothetical protein
MWLERCTLASATALSLSLALQADAELAKLPQEMCLAVAAAITNCKRCVGCPSIMACLWLALQADAELAKLQHAAKAEAAASPRTSLFASL